MYWAGSISDDWRWATAPAPWHWLSGFIPIGRSIRGLSSVVIVAFFASTAAVAAPSGVHDRLNRYEEMIFGSARTNAPIEARLKELESNVFGKSQRGTLQNRLDAIEKVLGRSHAQQMLPPTAPQVDPTGASASAATGDRKEGRVEAHEHLATELNDLIRSGMEAYSQGRFVDAERNFHEVLRLDSRNADAFYNLGVVAERRGDLPAAAHWYRAAFDVSPGDRQSSDALVSVENKLYARQANMRLSRQWPQSDVAGAAPSYKARVGQLNAPTVPVVEQQRSRGNSGRVVGPVARAALGIGLSAALGGTGLHCPMCRLVRLGF